MYYKLMAKKNNSVQGYWQNEFCFSRQEGNEEGPVENQQKEQMQQQREEIEEEERKKSR